MKIFQYILCGAAALSMIGCQAPLYDAYKRQDVPALKRGLAAGEDPNATEPANWWWKVPTIPLALAVDISRLCLGIATLGLYPELEYLIRDSRTDWPFLTEYVCDYGSVSVAEAVEERCKYPYDPKTCGDREVSVRVALLESGKVNSRVLLDWCLDYAVYKNDIYLAQKCLNKGANVRAVINDKTQLMKAIEAGNENMARLLIQYGANIHETTNHYSCQFLAQESGNLNLYKSLGGTMVAQPVAPPIPCSACGGDGILYSGLRACARCSGRGIAKETSYVSREEMDITGNMHRYQGYESHYGRCSSCSGSGNVTYSVSCDACNGVGSFPRYGTNSQ